MKHTTDILVIKHHYMEKLRACPVCSICGSKKFDRIKSKETIVRCVKCGKELAI